MIQLVTTHAIHTTLEASYVPSARTFDIVSGMMSDECRPYRIAQNGMLWLCEEGFLGELECIYPRQVDTALCSQAEQVSLEDGFPQLDIPSCDNLSSVQLSDDRFIVWLAAGKVINHVIASEDIHFMFSDDELVAIEARRFKRIVYPQRKDV